MKELILRQKKYMYVSCFRLKKKKKKKEQLGIVDRNIILFCQNILFSR